MNIDYTDLVIKGYIVIKSFLTNDDMNLISAIYNNTLEAESTKPFYRGSQSIDSLSFLDHKISAVSRAIRNTTNIHTDLQSNQVLFFDNTRRNFDWHLDHGSFFYCRDFYNFLNFWIPFSKDDNKMGGLDILPFDVLKDKDIEAYNKIIGTGAKKFKIENDTTFVQDDDYGKHFNINFNIDNFYDSPEITKGDLILLRGDTIHRTNISNSPRKSISIRCFNSHSIISQEKLLTGTKFKEDFVKNTQSLTKMKSMFEHTMKDTMTFGEAAINLGTLKYI